MNFGEAKQNFSKYVTSKGASDPQIASAINFVQSRFLKSPNHYKGSRFITRQTAIPVNGEDASSQGTIIATPAWIESIDAIRAYNPNDTSSFQEPFTIKDFWFAFREGSLNFKSEFTVVRASPSPLPLIVDPSCPQTLKFWIPAGSPDLSGIQVSALDYSQNIQNFTMSIAGDGNGTPTPIEVTSLLSVDLSAVTPTRTTIINVLDPSGRVMATWQPYENEPLYQRYNVLDIKNSDIREFTCLCTRRFIPLINDTDILPIANENALRYGLQAWRYEEVNDLERAQYYYSMAERVLLEELETFVSDATEKQINMRVTNFSKGRMKNLI